MSYPAQFPHVRDVLSSKAYIVAFKEKATVSRGIQPVVFT
jgi:hypothetical protein